MVIPPLPTQNRSSSCTVLVLGVATAGLVLALRPDASRATTRCERQTYLSRVSAMVREGFLAVVCRVAQGSYQSSQIWRNFPEIETHGQDSLKKKRQSRDRHTCRQSKSFDSIDLHGVEAQGKPRLVAPEPTLWQGALGLALSSAYRWTKVMAQRNQFPKKSTLMLAIAAALATMVPAVAVADKAISTAVLASMVYFNY